MPAGGVFRRLRSRGAWLLLLLALPAWSADPTRPTRAAMQKLRAQCERTLWVLEGPAGRGPGILVGQGGELLTSVAHVELTHARLHHGGSTHRGRVLYANATTGLALVRAPSALGLNEAVPIRVLSSFRPGDWVIAVTRDTTGALQTHPLQWIAPPPASGQAAGPRAALRAKLPLGTPLFDARGRLVATVVRERGGISWALPIEVMQQVVASGALE
ncbi:MAG TPA: serine protease [Myxococcaceae bacterium]|nr:serine protease [Myxococcaceae bacterium]